MDDLPLFVLPMVLFPGEVQELRVFEPRYRQMLDDCLLDDRNFGLVLNDPMNPVNHWDGPMTYGCEAEIVHHETKGSNHFLKIIGGRRFRINRIIQPALPPFDHPMLSSISSEDGYYPDLETILDLVPEDSSSSKLYIGADVEFVDGLAQTNSQQQTMLKSIMQEVLKRIGVMMNLDDEILLQWVEQSPLMQVIDDGPESVYSVAAMVVNDLETRQQILESNDVDESILILSNHLSTFIEEE